MLSNQIIWAITYIELWNWNQELTCTKNAFYQRNFTAIMKTENKNIVNWYFLKELREITFSIRKSLGYLRIKRIRRELKEKEKKEEISRGVRMWMLEPQYERKISIKNTENSLKREQWFIHICISKTELSAWHIVLSK